ncbi:Os08g0238100 [Oryza sativa Japonica Group]|uniref:Os08g0238100 protein n=1 Tax=Oryza sativa subsp. japonica TaxID=39947 RepID=Q0J729_ORYSJ|nr:Os08g0238100 [Oryza sativa Japonica Group]|eukprot:NP_001061322.2 Os08g0238100 [Oryza sativa Japonica Group]
MSKRTLFNYYSSGSSSTPTASEDDENTRQQKLARVEFTCLDIVSDPGTCKPIDEYPFEIRDQVKRAFVLRGPTQPVGYTFPCKWQSASKIDPKVRVQIIFQTCLGLYWDSMAHVKCSGSLAIFCSSIVLIGSHMDGFSYAQPSSQSTSKDQHGSNINSALKVLNLVPRKADYDKVGGPCHHQLIHDCMNDILGVQSNHTIHKGNGVTFNSCSNPAQAKFDSFVSNNGSALRSRTRFIKEDMFMLIMELHRKGETSTDQSILAAAMSSCADRQMFTQGTQLHGLLVKVGCDSTVFIGSSLITLYSRCSQLESSYLVFQTMPTKNTVSWTAMISGFALHNRVEPCLHLFASMRLSSCKPNDITFATLFSVCTNHALLALGKSVHALQMRMGFHSYVHVSNALLSMYAKCGCIDEAQSIFGFIACKDLVSWNAMIFGCSQYGLAKHCLDLLKEMERQHIVPDALSFLGVLSSCRHARLVEEGRHCFKTMIEHGIKPGLDHYSCMVDLLGRAGLLEEAWDLIQTMSIPPNAVIWGSLLGSCRVHGNISIGIQAAEHRLKLEPGCAATHIQLANLYATIGCWSDVARVRMAMKARGLKTNIGCSWIEVGDKVYSFTAENRSKSHQVNNVLAILDCLQAHMECKYDMLTESLE